MPNPFHKRVSDRLLARGYRGGQHSAHHSTSTRGEITGAIDRLWHEYHGNTLVLSLEQQLKAFEAFERERLALAGQTEQQPF